MALNRLVAGIRTMGPSDWMPFGIVAIALVLAVLFPMTMMGVAFVWSVFVVVRMGPQIRKAEDLGDEGGARSLGLLTIAFVAPSFVVIGAAGLVFCWSAVHS